MGGAVPVGAQQDHRGRQTLQAQRLSAVHENFGKSVTDYLKKMFTQSMGGHSGGLLKPGNIDLFARPVVKNPDGTISTVRSMSVNFGNGEVLIPTVSPDGQLLSTQDAIRLFRQTGQHLGIFSTPAQATQYAESLHRQQAKQYGGGQ